MQKRIFIGVLLAFIMVVPFGAAEWAGRGTYEPDTARDRADNARYMYEDPDTNPSSALHQTYFNAWIVQNNAGLNTNSAVVKSNHAVFPSTDFAAVLGIWKDCNGDGYIGMVDGAFFDYRAELLLDSTICPADASDPYSHNDGEWVNEFIYIGPDAASGCSDTDMNPGYNSSVTPVDDNPRALADDCARVWGDIGLPEDVGAITCPLNPQPRGTTGSTGGVQRYADCIANYRMYDSINTVADASEIDEMLGIQIDMHDAPRDDPRGSGSVLNQKNPYGGDDAAGPSYVVVFDCSGEDDIVVSDPTFGAGNNPLDESDENGFFRQMGVKDPTDTPQLNQLENSQGYLLVSANVSAEDGGLTVIHPVTIPTGVNPDGTLAGTANETIEGAPDSDCDRNAGNGPLVSRPGNLVETDFEPSTPVRKDTDITFTFTEGVIGPDSWTAGDLGARAPDSFGQGLVRDQQTTPLFADPAWRGAVPYTASRNGFVNLDSALPQPAQYFSFYAYLSPQALAVHNAQTKLLGYDSYGNHHCQGTTPITDDWECDPADWWPANTWTVWNVRVGQLFNFRDIDCYDETYVDGQPTTWTAIGAVVTEENGVCER